MTRFSLEELLHIVFEKAQDEGIHKPSGILSLLLEEIDIFYNEEGDDEDDYEDET